VIFLTLRDRTSGVLVYVRQVPRNTAPYIVDTPRFSNVTAEIFTWDSVQNMAPVGFPEFVNIP